MIALAMAPSHAYGAGQQDLPPLNATITIDGVIHPGNQVHPQLSFDDGRTMDVWQTWYIADDYDITENVIEAQNIGWLTLDPLFENKYIKCEVKIEGYAGKATAGPFYVTHPFWLGKVISTESGHKSKCPYCDKTTDLKPHDYKIVGITEATCTSSGKSIQLCSTCGYESIGELPARGHEWNEPTYLWGRGNMTCIATRRCIRECGVEESCTGVVKSRITKPAEIGMRGETTYTATFDSDWASTQQMTVEDIAPIEKPNAYPEQLIPDESGSDAGPSKPQEQELVDSPTKEEFDEIDHSNKGQIDEDNRRPHFKPQEITENGALPQTGDRMSHPILIGSVCLSVSLAATGVLKRTPKH